MLPEYPRPQMARAAWQNLNGWWDYAVTAKDARAPARWDGRILVPFPIESQLSGVRRAVGPAERLWYRRDLPRAAPAARRPPAAPLRRGGLGRHGLGQRARGRRAHRGGYDPFTFDITDALKPGGRQELVVSVWDPTDSGPQPRGKQVLHPHGIWYTAVTGIWQTVWLEPVPGAYVSGLVITPDVDAGAVRVAASVAARRAP